VARAALQTAAFNEFYTTYLKKIAGALRPSFLAMCEWDGTACQASGCNARPFQAPCTQRQAAGRPGRAAERARCAARSKSSRQSFPSGHSSNAFAGLPGPRLALSPRFPRGS
jgi:membrane-associated phospholipid phosphatase